MAQRNGNLRVQKLLNQCSEQKSNDSIFGNVETLPPDEIFNTKQAFLNDNDKRKVNLGIGAYRDDNGKPYVLKVVRKVEQELASNNSLNKEYLQIEGDRDYVKLAQKLILGDCERLNNGSIVGAQGISGTGSLRILFEFIREIFGKNNNNLRVLISNPTWGNHKKIIEKAGLNFDSYTYWNEKERNLNLDGMLNDLKTKGKKGDIILLHACAHNPTGVDPTKEQWDKIADTIKECGLIPFFDSAYQGFATGSLDDDAYAVRLFEKRGFEFFIAQSFAKNLGLYCERAGCASIVTRSKEAAIACMTQLCAVIRPMYSNPPAHGALIVKAVLGDPNNYKLWREEMNVMSGQIIAMRKKLRAKLEELKTPGSWNHITDQIGMFTFTGLTAKQVQVMTDKHHIYLLKNGRISMAGVCSANADYIAQAINDVVVNCK